ncbi:hypothetical protein K440DRAFT_635945 [Wilcoxina mikolae CBS 423.85]|nr:hypothetical protein K440DRAFT_635945 [Wilcoxina mikolae CBS 423.85]
MRLHRLKLVAFIVFLYTTPDTYLASLVDDRTCGTVGGADVGNTTSTPTDTAVTPSSTSASSASDTTTTTTSNGKGLSTGELVGILLAVVAALITFLSMPAMVHLWHKLRAVNLGRIQLVL